MKKQMINGFEVRTMLLAELKPADWNPRKISPDQLEALKRSLDTFGVVEPPIMNDVTGNIVGGHQRVKALLASGVEKTDVIVISISEAEEKQLNIALNRISGEWDDDLLGKLLREMQSSDIDTSITGFDQSEIADLLREEESEDEERRELTEEQEANVNSAWQEWADDSLRLLAIMQQHGVNSPNYTSAVARIHFFRSLYQGYTYPRWCSFAFHLHQFQVAGDNGSVFDALIKMKEDASLAKHFRWFNSEVPDFDKLFRSSLPMKGHRIAPDVPAELAKELINEFCIESGAVLDPCHGWGGRMVGFLLSKARSYTGFDPSEATNEGVKRIFKDFSRFTLGKSAKLHCACFEDSKLKPNSFDFAITSPPYFDVEKYDGDQTSWRRYRDFDEWNEKFYRELMQRTARALKKDCVFVLNVGNQRYPLEERAKEHAAKCGMQYVTSRSAGIINNLQGTSEERGEGLVIFRKEE